ncbi:hypothetical protein POM88_049015 [Heracleum sosnowskyi]|uniref:Uncharacterized protein n=1 Tax=Heracleum sosnowskyi TaxID=360622 RepID=A0AAD8M112_9APIA|nr:hypothetical protein POM88_049015 [Heracleum sosnowskyi]
MIPLDNEGENVGVVLQEEIEELAEKLEEIQRSYGVSEGVSKGMLDRMEEEYGSMLSTTGTSSVANSSSSTSMRNASTFHCSWQDLSEDLMLLALLDRSQLEPIF